MNNKAKKFLKNFSYTLGTNLVNMIISALLIFILPKVMGIEEYSYWQLYLFYSVYVPFLQLGWTDGIYLRFGGQKYEGLNKKLFFSQFILLLLFQIIIGVIMYSFASIYIINDDKKFIIQIISIFLAIINVRYFFTYILQATNRFKEFSQIILIDRILFLVLVFLFLFFGVRDYKLLILLDLIGKFVSLIYAAYLCKEILTTKILHVTIDIKELMENISVGSKIMFSNTVSLMIVGVIRLGIERSWDINTFGKVSLTLNISNFVMIFINAMGMVIFPILRRVEEKKLPNIYHTLRTLLMACLLGTLIMYYPLKYLLSIWLPSYSESVLFMALVFL
nr:oligosaccharide flippase family protein [Planococcus glaciei]